jgi:hypothetical protein
MVKKKKKKKKIEIHLKIEYQILNEYYFYKELIRKINYFI